MCLLGDRSQIPNVSKYIFSVIMVGLTTAARILLRKWKTNVTPGLGEWLDAMVETASYEAMLQRLKNEDHNAVSLWELFWSYARKTKKIGKHNLVFGISGPESLVVSYF